MLSRFLDPQTGSPRDGMFWLVLSGIVAAQLLVFWMLCTHQVRKAETRQALAEVERMASNDCLEFLVQSTIGSCAARPGATPSAESPTNVNLAYR
jgi:cytochrome oxidase assembly protein ShyY1